jgi:hypothetical protein
MPTKKEGEREKEKEIHISYTPLRIRELQENQSEAFSQFESY